MKKVIAKTNIKRDSSFLYCCGTSEDGYLTILQVDKSSKSKGKKK